ncbi:response regulator transcription factor [Keratinibaculum paraultunense]|jgi:two-component system response regulator VanR|uniref:response regulator transcription factor n=1 Tax=Keratinibaculum paraultunense TaxID=1278232 RepID=UPI00192BBED9|nr:response regulator transcription factor [Keratinibaculum paraultunense]QQY79061.1 response regulator transcription factor [Keratinibaculum paraultunense]
MGKIVVVDDEKEIADLIALYLTNEGFEVVVFYDSQDAMEYLEDNIPKALILDIMMPKIDGLTMLTKIREKYYYPVVLVTAKNEDLDVIKGLMLGSDDYIKKPFNPLELVTRVKALLRRIEVYEELDKKQKMIFQYKDLQLNLETRDCYVKGKKIDLTTTEFEILTLLLMNIGKKLSSEWIYKSITGDDYYNMAYNSVATHIRNLRIKLGDSFENPHYIKTVWGEGYVIEKND